MALERLLAEHFAREAIGVARATSLQLRTQDVSRQGVHDSRRIRLEDVALSLPEAVQPWHVRYRPLLIGGAVLAACLVYRRWKRGRGLLWQNPSRRALLRRRAYLRALRSSELEQLQPADREHAARALTALFDQDWKPWLKRMVAKGVSVHDATYWLPTKLSPDLAKFLRTHVTDAPRKSQEHLHEFMTDLEAIARGWEDLQPEQRMGSVKDVAKRLPSIAYPEARHVELSREAKALGMDEGDYYRLEKRWLEAVNKKTPKSIPSIYIHYQGKTGEYILRNLDQADPKGLFLGAQKETKCCQKPGYQAESCAWHGVESPNGIFYVMETEEGNLVAMSWTWRRDQYVVFDSIESEMLLEPPPGQERRIFEKDLKEDIALGFQMLAETILREDPSVAEVRLGGRYSVVSDIEDKIGWQHIQSSTHGHARNLSPRQKLLAKVLDEHATGLILHPQRCYTDASYSQFIIVSRPKIFKEKGIPHIVEIIESSNISNKQRYSMAKNLPANLKMPAAILGKDLSDRQRFELAKGASKSDTSDPNMIQLLSETISPRYILPFISGMTEKQASNYLKKNLKDLPKLFFFEPRVLFDFIMSEQLPKEYGPAGRRFYGRKPTSDTASDLAQELIMSRIDESIATDVKRRSQSQSLYRGKPLVGAQLTADHVFKLLDVMTEETREEVIKYLVSRFKDPSDDFFVSTDVGKAAKARFVPLFMYMMKKKGRQGYSYYSTEASIFGRALGGNLNGLTIGQKLDLVYRMLDDPDIGLSRETVLQRNFPAQEFVSGFIFSAKDSISPKQIDRLLSKLLLEHDERGQKEILSDVVKPVAEQFELPKDMRFTMAMLLPKEERRGILFKHAKAFSKSQIYAILNIGPMAIPEVESNPFARGTSGFIGI
jgi:hypothetical protein